MVAKKAHYACKLSKVSYGLKQSIRALFDKLKSSMLSRVLYNLIVDSILFVLNNEEMIFHILIYVDAILLAGIDSTYAQTLVAGLNSHFPLKNLGELNYFLGLEAHGTAKCLLICQSKYAIDLLIKTQMHSAAKLYINDGELFEDRTYKHNRSSSLLNNRLDISFVVNKLSQILKAPIRRQRLTCKCHFGENLV